MDLQSPASGVFLLIAALLIFGAGMWTYRYWLKRDPDKLEKWAQDLKRLRDQAKERLS